MFYFELPVVLIKGEVEIKIYNPQNHIIIIIFVINICYGCIKEMSLRDNSFMHPKHMLL